MTDQLGDRIKKQYEDRTRYFLPRRTYTIIRIDGKAFHSYTSKLERPFDLGLIEDMNMTTQYLCESIQGAQYGYVQSDEISLLLTDFEDINTQAWFDGNIQKIASVAASLATAKFNQLRYIRACKENEGLYLENIQTIPLACFDARAYTIPDRDEVLNYFIWRQNDCSRNSINQVARFYFSHSQLEGKNTNQVQDKLFLEEGVNWDKFSVRCKRGGFIFKHTENDIIFKLEIELNIINDNKLLAVQRQDYETAAKLRSEANHIIEKIDKIKKETISKNVWNVLDPPIFTKERIWISGKTPKL